MDTSGTFQNAFALVAPNFGALIMSTRSIIHAFTCIALALTGSAAGADITISRTVFGCNGGLSTSASFTVNATIGEGVVGVATSANFAVSAGFWYSSYSPVPSCPADFNADGFLTFEDFDAFVAAFSAGQPISDFNNDGFITFDDFDAFVLAFEAGC